jgi:hypothetical protein
MAAAAAVVAVAPVVGVEVVPGTVEAPVGTIGIAARRATSEAGPRRVRAARATSADPLLVVTAAAVAGGSATTVARPVVAAPVVAEVVGATAVTAVAATTVETDAPTPESSSLGKRAPRTGGASGARVRLG